MSLAKDVYHKYQTFWDNSPEEVLHDWRKLFAVVLRRVAAFLLSNLF